MSESQRLKKAQELGRQNYLSDDHDSSLPPIWYDDDEIEAYEEGFWSAFAEDWL